MKKLYSLFLMLASSFAVLCAQQTGAPIHNMAGTDFWAGVLYNADAAQYKEQGLLVDFYVVAGAESATVRVYDFQNGVETLIRTLNLQPYQSQYMRLSQAELQLVYPDINLGSNQDASSIHFVSSAPIRVFMGNSKEASMDASFVLPTTALSTDYKIQTYPGDEIADEFIVVATEDTTQVIFNLTQGVQGVNSGVVYTLMAGETYFVSSANQPSHSLSGSSVCSDKPVAVFTGNARVKVPNSPYKGFTPTFEFEQVVPQLSWGTEFPIVRATRQTQAEYVMVTALDAGTDVFKNGTLVGTIAAAGGSLQVSIAPSETSALITTSAAATAYFYMSVSGMNSVFDASGNMESWGNQSMALVTPSEMGVNDASFVAWNNANILEHYFNIVVEASGIQSMKVDDNPIPASSFSPVAGSNSSYYYVRYQVPVGAHHLTNEDGKFTGFAYGLGSDRSYSYALDFNSVPPVPELFIDDEYVEDGDTISVCQDQDTLSLLGRVSYAYDSIRWHMGVRQDTVIYNTPLKDSIVYFQYPDTGLYTMRMIVYSSTTCQLPVVDTVLAYIRVSPRYYIEAWDTICQHDEYYPFAYLPDNPQKVWDYNGTFAIPQVYDEPGDVVFRDSSLTVGHGCDSISITYLHITPRYFFQEQKVLIDKDSLHWHGKIYVGEKFEGDRRGATEVFPTGQTYIRYDSLLTQEYPCDSVYELTLEVTSTYLFEQQDTTCVCTNNGIYVWNDSKGNHRNYDINLSDQNIALNSVNTFYDSLKTVVEGNDSVYVLYLYVQDTAHLFVEAEICDNKTYTWRGHQDNRIFRGEELGAGYHIFYDTLKTVIGACDSITELHLTVNPTYNIHEPFEICDNEPFEWYGTTWQPSQWAGLPSVGDHKEFTSFKRYPSQDGCDSLRTLDLVIWPTYFFPDTHRMCDNEEFTWTGRKNDLLISGLSEGTYIFYDSLTSIHGCDSVYKLTVIVDSTYHRELTATVCGDDTYTWNVGTTTKVLDNPYVFDPDLQVVDPLVKNYDTMLVSVHGCDSLISLQLTINPTYYHHDSYTICDNETYVWHDQECRGVAGTHTFYDKKKTVNGCDSIYELTLTVNKTYNFLEVDTICEYEDFQWHGKNIDKTPTLVQSGLDYITYWDSLQTQQSCDSVFCLHLYVAPRVYSTVYDTICQTENYGWLRYSFQPYQLAPGDYSMNDTLTTQYGCDSVITLNLTVYPTYFTELPSAVVCQEEDGVYYWTDHEQSNGLYMNGQKVSQISIAQAGLFTLTDSLLTTHGCDSVFTMELRVNPSYYFLRKDTISDQDQIIWAENNDTVLTTTGYYEKVRYTTEGCDSIYAYQLLVGETYLTDVYDTICDNVRYEWEGQVCASGTDKMQAGEHEFRATLKTQLGFDSVLIMHLFVQPTYRVEYEHETCQNGEFTWPEQKSGQIYDPLQKAWLNAVPTTVAGTFEYYDSLTSVLTGCDSVNVLRLTVNPVYYTIQMDTICEYEYYTWHCQTHQEKADSLNTNSLIFYTYYDSLTTVGGCDSVFEFHMYVAPRVYTDIDTALCDNHRLLWFGRDSLLLPGNYDFVDTITSQYGCDSIVRLHVTVSHAYLDEAESFTACQGETFTWFGHEQHQLYIDGSPTQTIATNMVGTFTYVDSLTTINTSCDSIWTLTLTVLPSYHHLLDTVVSDETLPFVWTPFYHPDQTYTITGAGTYYDSLTTLDGCDSISTLRLEVGDVFRDTTFAWICAGETYEWHRLSTTGTDSIAHIGLSENKIYADSFKTVLGFDSIYSLKLTVFPTHHYEAFDTICQDSRYIWADHERVLYYEGLPIQSISTADTGWFVITDSLQTLIEYKNPHTGVVDQTLCDSVWTLHLYVAPVYTATTNTITDVLTMCDNDTITWEGRLYVGDKFADYGGQLNPQQNNVIPVSAGLTQDNIRFTTQLGEESGLDCDSIRFLELTVHATSYVELPQIICGNDSTFHFAGKQWNFTDLTEDTEMVLYDTVPNLHGCDSVTRLNLTIYPAFHFTTDTTVCANDIKIFAWRGRNYLSSGTYFDNLTTIHGCDSTYQLNLTVLPVIIDETERDLCEDDTIEWYGKIIYATEMDFRPGDYHRYVDANLPSETGCYNIMRLFPHFHRHQLFEENVTICSNEDFIWTGHKGDIRLTEPGVYWDSLYSIHGCDSIFKLTLTIHPAYYDHTYDTICSGDTYSWRNHTYSYTQGGEYTDSVVFHTQLGCDSTFYLHLKVNQSYLFVTDTAVCCDQSYVFRSYNVDSTGVYWDSLTTVDGCDSIYMLRFEVLPLTYHYLYDTVCYGDTYHFHDQLLTRPGVYADVSLNEFGCHVYDTLFLSMKEPTTFKASVDAAFCADAASLEMHYTYSGEKPIAYTVIFSDEAKKEGFEDVIWEVVSEDGVISVPVSRNADVAKYPRPNVYEATLYLDNGFCLDSTLMQQNFRFSVQYPSWITEQRWNDIIAVLNDSLNGGYVFTAYQWYHNGEMLPGETGPYLYLPHHLAVSDSDYYQVEVTRQEDGARIFSCPLYPQKVADEYMPQDDYVSIVPTMVSKSNPIVNILTNQKGFFALIDPTGKRLVDAELVPDEHAALEVELPAIAGTYIFFLQTDNGYRRFVKVIVY